MKAAIICFTKNGLETAVKTAEGLKTRGITVELAKKSRYLPDSIACTVRDWTGIQFEEADALIFVGACGIAVRSIAPFVTDKTVDPAVLVIDEYGSFVISLLSGHLGGANQLAEDLAKLLDAVPVVTTATDLEERFAVDLFAKENHCAMFPAKSAKEVSAALLSGKPVGFYTELPFDGPLPEGLVLCEKDRKADLPKLGIAVTIHSDLVPFETTVFLVPRIVTLGMGCKKGKDAKSIQAFATQVLHATGIYPQALCALASIDLKKEESGLQALADEFQIPYTTYSKEELMQVPGTFSASEFVRQTTGADNVCERSAVLAAGNGVLIRQKTGAGGMTAALAQKEWRLHFE